MRKSRQWSNQSRAKLSASLRGVAKQPQHRAKISQSMKNYWSTIPSISDLEAVCQSDNDIITGYIREPEGANQAVPPEPMIVTDHGVLERIVREVLKELDITTYQGKENVKNVTK